GAFNDNDIDWWKDDLKIRGKRLLIFIGAVVVLAIFTAFLPKSEHLEQLTAPAVEQTVTNTDKT
ncbi:MAG: hypothetical protein J5740_00465, partial [Bacteroidales bacterium]|nr:hypothetical protein [Bacteroidales bacterium]